MKFTTCCWLLIALAGTTALAQTHPKKKFVRKHTVVRRRAMEEVPSLPYDAQQYCIASLRPPNAETIVFDSTDIFTYVEQMPMLNGQSIVAASRAVIEQYLVVPPAVPTGRVFVSFDIAKTGSVRNVRIVEGLRADLDSAVVTATRQLPSFTPGKQNGHVVIVRTTIPITSR
jgi:TonB family protein